MEEITVQQISSYIPYGLTLKAHNGIGKLKGIDTTHNSIMLYYWINGNSMRSFSIDCKPILRPMSDIEDYFEQLYGRLEHNDVTEYLDADFLDDHDHLEIEDLQNVKPEIIPYGTLKVLLKHHFDIFGLIDKGLAINYKEIYK